MKLCLCQRLSRTALLWRSQFRSQLTGRQQLSVALLLSVIFLSGCVGVSSTSLPPQRAIAELSSTAQARMPVTIGVQRYQTPAYSDTLIETLRATELFERVDYLDQLHFAPSLIARVEDRVDPTPSLTLITLLSFGLVPTVTSETCGQAFSLHPPDKPENKVLIDNRYEATTTVGWIALLKALSPEETILYPERHPRYRAALRQALLARSPDISRLAAPQTAASH